MFDPILFHEFSLPLLIQPARHQSFPPSAETHISHIQEGRMKIMGARICLHAAFETLVNQTTEKRM